MGSHEIRPQDEDPEVLVGLLERQLQSDPPPSGDEEARLRTQLSALYLEKLEDPLAAAVHVEELLQGDSIEGVVLQVATALLRFRPIAPRIAERLSNAYARLAQYESEAATLAVELSIAKPERLEGVKRRLAHLRHEKLGDPSGAVDLLEPLVERDPGDRDLLDRYVDAALTAERGEHAIDVLARARTATAVSAVRARLGYALGVLYLQEGELPKARLAFLSAVAEPVSDPAVLSSAHRLLALSRDPEDPAVLGPALEALVAQEPNAEARRSAAERLLALGAVDKDDPRAIPWWRALLGSARQDEALAELERLYEKAGDARGLVDTLSARAAAVPDRKLHARLLPLLEGAGRWAELCDLLEADAALASPEEAARGLAKVGQLRLARLKDEEGALSAFARSLELDPGNAVTRLWLEKLVVEGGARLRAAEILETASRAVASDEGVVAALETRAELSSSPGDRLDLLERAAEIVDRNPDLSSRGLALSGRGLSLAALHRSEALGSWLERARRFADTSDDRAAVAELFFEAAKSHPVDDEARCRLVCEAVDALVEVGRSGEALGLALRAFETFPGSLPLSKRIDRLTDGREPAAERRARHVRSLEQLARPSDVVALRHAIAEIDRDALSDLASAAAGWKAILALEPADERAKRGLVEAYRRTGDDEFLPGEGDVLEALDGTARSALLSGRVRSLIQRGERDEALEACRTLLAAPESDDAALEIVAGVAYEENDEALYREALERLAQSADAAIQVHALERLGHFFEQTGDRRAAAESWKPAALLSAGGPSGDEHARELYERVLAAAPDDREAAENLLELYVREARWVNVPGIYATLLHGSSNPAVTATRLLSLEDRAVSAGAIDEMVGMLDETLPYLGSTNDDARRRVMQSKARLLGPDAARRVDAARAHRALVEAFGGEDTVTEYAAFVEEKLDADERQGERRWLYEWRAAHGASPVNVLLEWGVAEEEYGEPLSAVRAYERAAEADPERLEPLEALARLKTSEGDLEGALGALRTLRARAPAAAHAELDVRIALLVGEELGRPEEALVTMAPLLASSPPSARAVDMARRALERPDELDRTVELIEKASRESLDANGAATNLELLIEAPLDEASLGERRESWIVRLADLRKNDPAASLDVLVRGVAHKPASPVLWGGLVALARKLSRADAVFDAFARAADGAADPATVERLGKQTIDFFDEWSSDSAEVRKTLEVVLEHVPGARWALDRLKLLLSSAGLWNDFFRVYDRAIESASRAAGDRAELLDEAALAARDLAGDPDRAIGYLEQLRVLRPNDAKVLSSLERLYERQGESAKLIALLSEREAAATGVEKEELQHRIAGLWLALGDIGSAHVIVETMIRDGVGLEDVADLLEKVLEIRPEHDALASPKSPHSRAITLLVQHHGALGRVADVIRVRECELGFARDQRRRARVVRTLVRLYLEAEGDSDDAFLRVIPKVQAFDERDAWLGNAAAGKLSSLAKKAWERRGSSPESGAAQAALWAVRKLEDGALRASNPEAAAAVLLEGARSPFGRDERRELVRDAAIHLADRVDAKERAVELLRGLFLDDPTDAVISPEVDRLARLMEAVASVPDRAELWEALGQRAVDVGSSVHGRGYFTLAAELWEITRDPDRAIAARRRSASLGSEASLDALARLYRERGEWRPAAEALEWAFAATDAGGKPRLGMLLGDAYLALGEREPAEARLEAVLTDVPGETAVRERLAELYREDASWGPLAALLVAGAAATTESERRLSMLREAAHVRFERLGDPAGSIPLFEAAMTIATSDAGLALSLADALDATGRHRDAARVLRQQLSLHGELRPKSRAPLHHRLAQVLVHMGNAREALAEFRAAVEIDPSNPGMLYDLARSALSENQLDVAESTYRALLLTLHRAEPGNGPSRVDVYLDLSEVAARRNDHARAADYIESSFEVSLEGLEEALQLEKALEARGRHDLVARSVERRLRAARDPRAAAAALGQLLALHEAHAEKAADLLPVIVRHSTEIEKQVEQGGTTDPDVWAILARAARIRGGEKAERELLANRVAALEEQARATTGREGHELLREAARAAEQDLGDRARAASLQEALVARSPDDWEAWTAVFRLSAPLDDAAPLVALADRAALALTSTDDRSKLRLALARFFMDDPRHAERAARTLKKLLDEDSGRLEAAELLADALEREGRDAELVELLVTRLEAARKAGDPPAVAALSLRLGAALERAGRKDRAVAVYDAIVEDASTDRRTLEAVSSRLEALDAPSLANALERLLERHPGEGAAALAKRLVVLRDAAGDGEAALRAAAFAFDLDPADAALRARLVEEYERRGRIADARAVLGRAVAVAPDDRALFLAWIDAALRTGELDEVVAALDRGIEASPSDTELLRERARARQAQSRDEEALSDWERAYALDPSFAFEMRSVLERLVEQNLPDGERYTLALVDVLLEQGEDDRARDTLLGFVDAHPEHVGGLERFAAQRAAEQDFAGAIAAYERLLPLVGGDHEEFARLTLAFAETCDRAGGSAQARAALERAYEFAPDRSDLRERLEAIYEAEGDRARLSDLLVAGAGRAADAARKASLYFRAAELRLAEPGGAERALSAVLAGREAEPANVEGSLLYAKALRALDRDDEALEELSALIGRSRGRPAAAMSRAQLEVARIYLDADYLHEGFDALKMAYQLDARNVEAAYLLGLVAIDVNDEATASRALRAVTAIRDDKTSRETRAMAFYHLGRLAQWKGDRRRAQSMAKSALSENPECDVAKHLLEALGR